MKTARRNSPVGGTVALAAVAAVIAALLVAPTPPLSATGRAPSPWVKPRLMDVTVLAPDDVWVVGHQIDATGDKWPLILHRDATGWTEAPVARGGWEADAWLVAVDAAAADDVWAVGNYRASGRWWHPLILHSDGVTWTRVPAPGLHNYVELTDVVAIDATSAFVVGRIRGDPLVLEWDGSEWTRRPFPMTGERELDAVDAAEGRMWVTGAREWYAAPQAYRFAAGRWAMPAMPPLPDYDPWVTMDAHLVAVEVQRTNRVWAVGSQLLQTDYGGDFLDNRLELVVERWDGHRWRLVAAPRIRGPFEEAVDVASMNGAIWVAGYRTLRTYGRTRALVLIRTSEGWWAPALPGDVLTHRGLLTAVDGMGRRDVWAVGRAGGKPLILRGDGGTWVREL